MASSSPAAAVSSSWTLAHREGTIDSLYRKQVELSHGIDELRDNSLKAMKPSGGVITERYAMMESSGSDGTSRVEMIFADNGIGMTLSRLMESVQINSQREELRSNRNGTSILGMGVWVALRALHPEGCEDEDGFTTIYTSTEGSAIIHSCRINIKAIRDGGAPAFKALTMPADAHEITTYLRLVNECDALTVQVKNGAENPPAAHSVEKQMVLGDPFRTEDVDSVGGIPIVSSVHGGDTANLLSSLSKISGTVIHVCSDVSSLCEDEAELTTVIDDIIDRLQYNYQFPSLPCLPIFVQRRRQTNFETIENQFYIPRNMDRTTLKLEFEDAQGCFACSDPQKNLRISHDALSVRNKSQKTTSQVVDYLTCCLKKAREDDGSYEVQDALLPGSGAFVKFDVCSDHRMGLEKNGEDTPQWNDIKTRLMGFIREENWPNDDAAFKAMGRPDFMGILMYSPIGPYPGGKRRLGPVIPYSTTKLFGKFSAHTPNGINSCYPFYLGFMLRTEVVVSEECQRARLFNIDMVKSASRPLASVDGKVQIFMAKLIWSITRSMLAPQKHTIKIRKNLIAAGETKYPYKMLVLPPLPPPSLLPQGSGLAPVVAESGKSDTGTGSRRNKRKIKPMKRWEGPPEETAKHQKKSASTIKSRKQIAQQKVAAQKTLAVARAKHNVLAQSRRQELSRFDRRWKRELSTNNPRSLYARKRTELIAHLDKEAKKEDKKLRDAQLKVEGILGLQGAGSPRKKRKTSSSSEVVYKHLLARRFPVGTRIQGFFKGEEEASSARWYPGTVVGHTSHGCTMWVKYDSDEEPWEQKLDFSLNPQECRLIGSKASTHRLMLSASASAAAKGVAAPASSPAGLVSGSFREITLQQADQTIGLALENGQSERKGVCVSSTTNGSLAALAKFKAGDIVVAINGFKVNSAEDAVTVITALRGEGTLKYVFTLSDGAASNGVGAGDAGEFPESLLVPSVCMPQPDGLRSVESEGLVPIVSSSPAVVKAKKHTAAKEATSAMGIRLDDEDIAQEPAAAKVPDSAIGVRPHDNDAIAKESAAAKDAVSALGIRLGDNEDVSKEPAAAKEAASVMPAVASAAQEVCVTSAASAASAAQRGLFVTPAAMVQTKHHLLNMQRQMHTLMDQLP